jgi:hypothetical protein
VGSLSIQARHLIKLALRHEISLTGSPRVSLAVTSLSYIGNLFGAVSIKLTFVSPRNTRPRWKRPGRTTAEWVVSKIAT